MCIQLIAHRQSGHEAYTLPLPFLYLPQMLDKVQEMSKTSSRAADLEKMFSFMKQEHDDSKQRAAAGEGPYAESSKVQLNLKATQTAGTRKLK